MRRGLGAMHLTGGSSTWAQPSSLMTIAVAAKLLGPFQPNCRPFGPVRRDHGGHGGRLVKQGLCHARAIGTTDRDHASCDSGRQFDIRQVRRSGRIFTRTARPYRSEESCAWPPNSRKLARPSSTLCPDPPLNRPMITLSIMLARSGNARHHHRQRRVAAHANEGPPFRFAGSNRLGA